MRHAVYETPRRKGSLQHLKLGDRRQTIGDIKADINNDHSVQLGAQMSTINPTRLIVARDRGTYTRARVIHTLQHKQWPFLDGGPNHPAGSMHVLRRVLNGRTQSPTKSRYVRT
ncbi:hypothetical protein HPB50_005168 [Hyalomma asiaticum]|uniref:Uncharacterized protein n=1 Tax=Hyalomma asiaticum TaxID=266040 RepID=A0ACB7RM27_HYAAI|nr:hypothetical protein HPB50_005168 [Hyalomma asiaticum]